MDAVVNSLTNLFVAAGVPPTVITAVLAMGPAGSKGNHQCDIASNTRFTAAIVQATC